MPGSDDLNPPNPRDSNRARDSGGFVPRPVAPGATLGRYELIEVLGHGAMATVFRARDARLSRDVALKVMNLTVAARGDSGERFRREAQAVAAVKHPSIVEIFDFVGAEGADPAFIVSELISGVTLRGFLHEGRPKVLPEIAALLLLPICDALAAAHARGIVHRDVKPDNVMIERDDGRARVVLTDFGVAQVAGLETMTATGAIVGSPAYMSPEQARGKDLGPATDLWSVGVMFYEMVTGALPFAGKDPLLVIAAIATGQYRRAGIMAASVGAETESVISRALKSDLSLRFTDAGALTAGLRTIVTAAGLQHETAELRAYLEDPEGFEKMLRPKVAEQAVQRARAHIRKGELARALSEIGRIGAYVPNHPEADRLLKRVGARRLGRKVALLAGGATAIAMMGFGVVRRMDQKEVLKPSATAALAPPAIAAVLAPVPTPAPALPVVAPGPPAAAPVRSRPRPKRVLATNDHPMPTAPAPTVAPLPPPAAPVPTATAPVALPVKLTAQQGWCKPGLSAKAAGDTDLLLDLNPGVHAIYCAAEAQSPKEKVGTISIPPLPHRPASPLWFVITRPNPGERPQVIERHR